MQEYNYRTRKCVVSGEKHYQKDMFRIVRTPDGSVVVDKNGKENGRGAYLMKDVAIILKAKKTKVLEKHLSTHIPDEIFDELLSLVKAYE